MKIYLIPVTVGTRGGGLQGNLRYIDKYIERELGRSGFKSSFNELHLSIAYLLLYNTPGTAFTESNYKNYYDTLPYSRFDRKNKIIHVTLKAPEFSEHFIDKKHQKKSQFEMANEFKNLSDTRLAQILIDKYVEASQIIRSKMKKEDVFDFTTWEQVLNSIKQKITPEFLVANSINEKKRQLQLEIDTAESYRLERKNKNAVKDTLIRDVRISFDFELPKHLFYLRRYADLVLRQLIQKEFMCPHYHHLYIKIAGQKKKAIKDAIPVEDWFTYGAAVLKKDTLLKAEPPEQQSLILNAIREGLLDIADLDKLDKTKILEAINEAEETGVLTEIIFKAKENKRIAFVISTKTILGQNEEEIFFMIVDKETGRVARWKFGQENIFLIGGWFGTINVTNKKITIKPRAHMDLVLKGKQKIIELDVEKELADPAKIVTDSG